MNTNARALSIAVPGRGIASLALGLPLIAVLAYWPTTAALWNYWTTSWGGDQGLLVVCISAWLFYRSRYALGAAPVRPALWAAPLLLLASIASVVFWRAGIQDLQLLLLPVLMLLAILTAFGTSLARVALVPIGFLYFAMPAWSVLAVPLQHLTVKVVATVAPVLGLPATVSGTLISFPTGATFVVTRECGGAVFLVQGLAVATLIGELEGASLRRRVLLLGLVTALALVANWLRVLALIYIGYTTQMRHVILTRDHVLFGWVLFALVLVAFAWAVTNRAAPPEGVRRPAAAATQSRWLPGYVTALIGLAVIPLLASVLSLTHDAPGDFRLPTGHAGWQGPTKLSDGVWQPVFVGQHDQWHVLYADAAGRNVEAFAIGYPMQEQGRELVNEGNLLLGHGGLRAVTAALITAGSQRYIEETIVDERGQRSVVWYQYDIGGRAFVIPISSQLWYGVRSLSGTPYSALFAFRADCAPSCSQAREILTDFARSMGSEFLRAAGPGAPS